MKVLQLGMEYDELLIWFCPSPNCHSNICWDKTTKKIEFFILNDCVFSNIKKEIKYVTEN